MTQPRLDHSKYGDVIRVADGTCLFKPGDEGRAFLIVKAGQVRVEQTNDAGRTVVLYRVGPGESCVLTTTCLLSGRFYSGWGYAEGEVEAIAIPANRFHSLLGSDAAFRELVFEGFAHRVGELTDVIDALLTHRIDLRLARWLGSHPDQDIARTQQDIAQELGTVREVISRTLKSFEQRGWITLHRGSVHVGNRSALLAFGQSDQV